MAFDHTAYAHRTGRRSRPRNAPAMESLLAELDVAIEAAVGARMQHRRKNLRGKTRDLQVARAMIVAAMIPARQETARFAACPQRRRAWGPPLLTRTARARREVLYLDRMLSR